MRLLKNLFLATAMIAGAHQAHAQASANVRINPFVWLIGFFNADIDIGLSESFTLGPSLGYLSASSGDVSLGAYTIGARANLFVSGTRFSDGFYLGPYVSMAVASVELGDDKTDLRSTTVGSYFGYGWYWPSGFNMHLGLGAQYVGMPESVEFDGVDTEVPSIQGFGPTMEFSMGYAF